MIIKQNDPGENKRAKSPSITRIRVVSVTRRVATRTEIRKPMRAKKESCRAPSIDVRLHKEYYSGGETLNISYCDMSECYKYRNPNRLA